MTILTRIFIKALLGSILLTNLCYAENYKRVEINSLDELKPGYPSKKNE